MEAYPRSPHQVKLNHTEPNSPSQEFFKIELVAGGGLSGPAESPFEPPFEG